MDPQRRRQLFMVLYLALTLGALWFFQTRLLPRTPVVEAAYSEVVDRLNKGEVKEIEVRQNELAAKVLGPDGKEQILVASRLPGVDDRKLVDAIEAKGVKLSGKIETTAWWETVLFGWLVPIALMVGLWVFLSRRISGRGGPLSFGKSQVKIYDQAQAEKVTFNDVAGVEEAEGELVEVVDFLKHPEKYRALGARIPKGVLLVGPPGTGKTLLAKAVAGEAAVPFFSMSGSGFVEMFVGVGAARVRDLFEQAKGRAPCIIFIDELDAIGKSRGGLAAFGAHDEREQTLNQLLAEMDGFDASKGVVIMAATNRPEILDAALVRAGRFDRQVLVDRPDIRGRADILKVHARKVKLAEGVDLQIIARRTPGMVGADLANIINEGALAAARRGGQIVEQQDLEEAIDRVQLGLKKRNIAMSESEKRRVAYHEGGHALVALSVEHADPVHRVTIIPRSIGALGATLQLPTEDRYMVTRDELLDRLCVMLGGRAAEEEVLGDISTGAQNDLERASETARQMVCRYGMSEAMGAQTFGRPMGMRFLESTWGMGDERNFSEDTARRIDAEVASILLAQRQRAKGILAERRPTLEAIAQKLLVDETLDAEDLERIVRETTPGKTQPSPEAR